MQGFKPDQAGLGGLDDPRVFNEVMATGLPMPLSSSLAAGWFLITEGDHALQPEVRRASTQQIPAQVINSSHPSLFL